jgi:hypothetical protein
VPNSHKKVFEEGEYVLFAITVLRGHYEAGSFVDDVFIPGFYVDIYLLLLFIFI